MAIKKNLVVMATRSVRTEISRIPGGSQPVATAGTMMLPLAPPAPG